MDRWVGRLVDELHSRGLYDRTMIVFTSDHGEEFADHDPTMFHDTHGHSAYEELVRVPLIVKLPGRREVGGRVGAVAGMIDLMPTILDVLGVHPERSEMQGVSLRPLWEEPSRSPPRIAFSEAAARRKEVKSLRTDRHKYIVEIDPEIVARHGRSYVPDQPRVRMLFDLVEDPLEKQNLLAPGDSGSADLASRLEQQLRAFVAARPGDTEQIVLDPETVEKLKALGYVD
jgi:arylsulfatase A-like enzyme